MWIYNIRVGGFLDVTFSTLISPVRRCISS
jgi:hypothetical protein